MTKESDHVTAKRQTRSTRPTSTYKDQPLQRKRKISEANSHDSAMSPGRASTSRRKSLDTELENSSKRSRFGDKIDPYSKDFSVEEWISEFTVENIGAINILKGDTNSVKVAKDGKKTVNVTANEQLQTRQTRSKLQTKISNHDKSLDAKSNIKAPKKVLKKNETVNDSEKETTNVKKKRKGTRNESKKETVNSENQVEDEVDFVVEIHKDKDVEVVKLRRGRSARLDSNNETPAGDQSGSGTEEKDSGARIVKIEKVSRKDERVIGEIEIEEIADSNEKKDGTNGSETENETKAEVGKEEKVLDDGVTCTVESNETGEFIVNIPLDQPVSPQKHKKV